MVSVFCQLWWRYYRFCLSCNDSIAFPLLTTNWPYFPTDECVVIEVQYVKNGFSIWQKRGGTFILVRAWISSVSIILVSNSAFSSQYQCTSRSEREWRTIKEITAAYSWGYCTGDILILFFFPFFFTPAFPWNIRQTESSHSDRAELQPENNSAAASVVLVYGGMVGTVG